MIIWLASYPRSGNTFMRRALHEMGELHGTLYSDDERQDALPAAYVENRERFDIDPRRFFVKTHSLENDTRKAIYIVRDGRDALVSHAHYVVDCVGTDRTYLEVLEMLIKGEYHPFATWSQHILFWKNRSNRLIIRYEDMITNINRQALRVAYYCGTHYGQVNIAFDKLHEANPKFYRRGIVGAWRDEMPDDLHELFWKYHSEAMQAAGYNR